MIVKYIIKNFIKQLKAMSKSEHDEYTSQLIKGLELAEYRMLRDKAMRNQTVIQGDGGTGVREVSARVLFTKIYHEPVPVF